MGEVVLVYTTWPDAVEAEQAGRRMVEEGLAACINILPGMVSVYRWNEAVERADETVMLIKTTTAGAPAVVEAVRALHPYQVPAVMVLPVAGGNPDFLSWIDASTRALSTKVK